MAFQETQHFLRDLERYDTDIEATYQDNTAEAARQLLFVDGVPSGRDENSRKVLSQVVKCYIGRDDVDVDEVVGPRARENGLISLLHLAASSGWVGIVRLLLEWGADPDDSNELQRYPLHMAATLGDRTMIQLLLKHGADPRKVHCIGKSLLHFVCEGTDDDRLVNQLLDLGLDVNLPERGYRNTPLHLAAKNGFAAVTKALLKRGANVAARNTEGCTPAHMATAHYRILRILAKAGADFNVSDAWGNTPLQLIELPEEIQGGKVVIRHLIKIQTATGIEMNPLNKACIDGRTSWRRIRQDCLEEIEAMKEIEVSETTCYDIFCLSFKELGKLLQKDKSLSIELSTMALNRFFPIYGKDLMANVQKVHQARKHAQRVSNFLQLSLGDYLPQEVLENIGSYLKPQDIMFK